MATFVLIHGAGDGGWYWHLLEAELRRRGHDVVAPDLPSEDDSAGLPEYADTVVDAIGDRADLVVVAQSFGGFTHRWYATGCRWTCWSWWPGWSHGQASRRTTGGPTPATRRRGASTTNAPADDIALFLHDVPPDLAAEALRRGRDQSATLGERPWPLASWPKVPTRFLVGRDGRFFPADFLHRVVRDRLGITADEIDGSHCVALSHQKELADRLEAYRVEL
jgi:hypothetical protein